MARYVIYNEVTGAMLGFGGRGVEEYPDAQKFDSYFKAEKAFKTFTKTLCLENKPLTHIDQEWMISDEEGYW